MQTALQEYLSYLKEYPNGDEIQYRTPFQNFFNDFTKEKNIKATIIQEYRKSGIETDGIPDFFVYTNYTESKKFVGFIECKKPTVALEKLINSEQIKKYTKTTDNIILTNYHRFILLQQGHINHDVILSNDQFVLQRFENLLKEFYTYNYP
jgi:hypothetical protein